MHVNFRVVNLYVNVMNGKEENIVNGRSKEMTIIVDIYDTDFRR